MASKSEDSVQTGPACATSQVGGRASCRQQCACAPSQVVCEGKNTTENLKEKAPQKWCIYTSCLSSAFSLDMVKKQGKQDLFLPSTGKKSWHLSDIKTQRLSKAKNCTRKVKGWTWTHYGSLHCIYQDFLIRKVWCYSRAAGIKLSQKEVLYKCLDRLKLKRTNYMTLPTVCKPGPDSHREE